jgi:hypothetical protein
MAESRVFDWVCENLAATTQFSAIEARGTVRIALKKSGLDTASLTAAQMHVVVKRVMPDELRRRGVEDSQERCDALAIALHDQSFGAEEPVRDSPEAVFARIA